MSLEKGTEGLRLETWDVAGQDHDPAGKSAQEVASITAMFSKAARTLLGAYAAGGPNFMTQENVDRIFSRPDEAYRQRVLGLKIDKPDTL